MPVKQRPASLVILTCTAGLILFPASSPAQPQNLTQTAASPALPLGLVPLPRGEVFLGSSPGSLVAAMKSLHRGKLARQRDAKRLLGELAPAGFSVEVAAFRLADAPVTMAQYKLFIEATGHRPPFGWWRYGCEAEYKKRAVEIAAEFPSVGSPALCYWEAHAKSLPWKIPFDRSGGEPVRKDEYPVVFVSRDDVLAYCIWAGVRLPTEAEWVYAARGAEARSFVWGNQFDTCPIPRGKLHDKPQAVGSWGPGARGQFGHGDMVFGVYEWTDDPYLPFVNEASFAAAQKSFTAAAGYASLRDKRPAFSPLSFVVKGGWYGGAKAELRIETRVPRHRDEVHQALGFRPAKSREPARDYAASSLRRDYDWSFFPGSSRPLLADQIGCEYYDLSADRRRIHGYHAVSFVPVSHLTEGKKIRLASVQKQSSEAAIVLGTLALTETAKQPVIGPGIYTLLYRHGTPQGLVRALRQAKAAVSRARDRRVDTSGANWYRVLQRHGISLDDVREHKTVDFVRLRPGRLAVPFDEPRFLLRDHSGKYVASFAATPPKARSGYPRDGAALVLTQSEAGEQILLRFAVKRHQLSRDGQVYQFELPLLLPLPKAGRAPWRLR